MTTTMNSRDTDLRALVVEELEWTPNVNAARLGVSVDHGAVTLSGEVDTFPERSVAERAVLGVRGVTAVAEEIVVHNPRGFSSDSDIARDAQQALERAVDVPATVKVVVHDHTITLSGPVTWQYQREAAGRAVHYLRSIRGVHNTITITPKLSAEGVKSSIVGALVRSAQLEGQAITVTADGAGVATITGTVQSWSDRNRATSTAWQAPGITGVVNELHVRP
jgi:osmotically-inducible protein OsmY